MPTILFNVDLFRSQFPTFDSIAKYKNAQLQTYWDMASAYVDDKYGGCYTAGLEPKQQQLALNLMTAHLTQLYTNMQRGQSGGVVVGSTIDKISIQLMPPPATNNWQFWLSQTPYGQQLLALLSALSSGGGFYGGFPVVPAFRR